MQSPGDRPDSVLLQQLAVKTLCSAHVLPLPSPSLPSHYPTTRFTQVADTPEGRRLTEQTARQSEVCACVCVSVCIHTIHMYSPWHSCDGAVCTRPGACQSVNREHSPPFMYCWGILLIPLIVLIPKGYQYTEGRLWAVLPIYYILYT